MGFYQDKIFPKLCAMAGRVFDEERREVFANAAGKVLEVGVGTGANFQYYPDSATEVIGVEFAPAMLEQARENLQTLQRDGAALPSVTLKQGSVTALDFADHSFDTVVTFLVFCSVSDPIVAANEIYRVLKPGGRLLFFEHVVARDHRLSKWQTRLNPVWKKVACGCNLTRDTRLLFEKTGFKFEEIREFVHPDSLKITSHKIQGIAVK